MSEHETLLMLRAREGDRAAFEELFRLYERPILNYVYRLSKNRALSEDLLQEAFLRLWRALPGYRPTAKVSTYVFRIAHNLYLNEAARRREKPIEDADSESRLDPGADMARRELQAAVRSAVEALPEGERECLILSEFQGFKYADIAEVLGIPVGTVKSRMFSAVNRLKESLRGMEPSP